MSQAVAEVETEELPLTHSGQFFEDFEGDIESRYDFSDFLQKPDIGPDGEEIPPLGPTDWYYRTFVPKDPKENLRFRRKVLKLAFKSRKFARELWIICSRDLLFYINTFGWLLEPRAKPAKPYYREHRVFGDAREVPFITRPYQDVALLRMWRAFGKLDICVPKSREVGASWMFLYLADWAWRFTPQCHLGMATKDEDTLDAPGATDSLFWKLQFINDKLPWFLTLDPTMRIRNQSSHMITNKGNASTIQGWAATSTMGTGGRKIAVFLDEVHKWTTNAEYEAMNSLQYVTHCRISISTPFQEKGQSGAFYDMVIRQSRSMEKIYIHWSQDREKTRGLYTSIGRRVVILDNRYDYPHDYPFICDGKKRSPYYDDACERAGSPQAVAAELDIDFGGSGDRIFEQMILSRMKVSVREAYTRASLVMDPYGAPTRALRRDPQGDIRLWIPAETSADGTLIIPKRRYSIGCDVSMGTGGDYASQSAAIGLDIEDCEQVFEWMDGSTNPILMADIVWCLGHIFSSDTQVAYVIPEANGPGFLFGRHFLKRGYSNPYTRRRSDSRELHYTDKKEGKFGYHNKDGGLELLMSLQEGIRRRGLKIRSERVLHELSRYQRIGDKAWHPQVDRKSAGSDKSHGDCAIAAACAWWGIRSERTAEVKQEAPKAVPGTAEYRRLEYLREQAMASNGSYWAPHS